MYTFEKWFTGEPVEQDAHVRFAFAKALAAYRKALRLSQRQIGVRMDTQQSVVGKIEKGSTDPRLGTFQRYARALGSRVWLYLTPLDIVPPDDPRSAWAYQALIDSTLSYGRGTWTQSPPVEGTIITPQQLDFWLDERANRPPVLTSFQTVTAVAQLDAYYSLSLPGPS